METLAHAIAQKFLRTEIVTVAINGRVDAICVGCIFSTSPPLSRGMKNLVGSPKGSISTLIVNCVDDA
jgi:hypothetical protein